MLKHGIPAVNLFGWKKNKRGIARVEENREELSGMEKDGRGIVRGVLNDGRRIVLNSKQAFRKNNTNYNRYKNKYYHNMFHNK